MQSAPIQQHYSVPTQQQHKRKRSPYTVTQIGEIERISEMKEKKRQKQDLNQFEPGSSMSVVSPPLAPAIEQYQAEQDVTPRPRALSADLARSEGRVGIIRSISADFSKDLARSEGRVGITRSVSAGFSIQSEQRIPSNRLMEIDQAGASVTGTVAESASIVRTASDYRDSHMLMDSDSDDELVNAAEEASYSSDDQELVAALRGEGYRSEGPLRPTNPIALQLKNCDESNLQKLLEAISIDDEGMAEAGIPDDEAPQF